MFKTYSSSSSLVITSRWFATSHLAVPASVRLVYWNTISYLLWTNSPISQILWCITLISHNAPFFNRNVHMCAHFCYKMVHCGIWEWCMVVHYATGLLQGYNMVPTSNWLQAFYISLRWVCCGSVCCEYTEKTDIDNSSAPTRGIFINASQILRLRSYNICWKHVVSSCKL